MDAVSDPVDHRSARISPTAHYTGYTWFAHGLSHPAFATSTGRVLYRALAPATPDERAFVRSALREHCAEWFPDVEAP